MGRAAKERALGDQQEALLQARTEADRKLDALNARLRGVAERERELEGRQAQLTQQVEAAQAELERRQAAAEARLEELAARERSLRRQEDGLEGVKVRACARVVERRCRCLDERGARKENKTAACMFKMAVYSVLC